MFLSAILLMDFLRLKPERIVKIETSPASTSAPTDSSNDQAGASIPTETVSSGPKLNRTVTVRRKAAKRADLESPPQDIAVPLSLSPSPQAEAIPAQEIPTIKKPRVEEPLPTTTDEAIRKTPSPDISEGLPSPDAPPRSTATVNVSTRRRSRRQIQIQLELIETSETKPDAMLVLIMSMMMMVICQALPLLLSLP
jgi:hypothetical protein